MNIEFPNGVYVGARLSPQSIEDIVQWADANKIVVNRSHFHVTLISSDKPGVYVPPSTKLQIEIVHCRPLKSGYDKKYLVLVFDSPALTERHNQLKQTVTPTYSGFTPHVTVSYDCAVELSNLTPPEFPITLIEEYAVPFVKGWSP